MLCNHLSLAPKRHQYRLVQDTAGSSEGAATGRSDSQTLSAAPGAALRTHTYGRGAQGSSGGPLHHPRPLQLHVVGAEGSERGEESNLPLVQFAASPIYAGFTTIVTRSKN